MHPAAGRLRGLPHEERHALEVVTELSGKGNRNDGYAVATDILQAHSEIVGIFAINDPSGLGAYAAVTRVAPAHIWSGIRKETPFLWRMAERKPTSHY